MRAMKDSGVEWIGKIPEAWEVRKVAQFWKASKGPNAALLTAEYCGEHSGQYPVYSGQTENNGVMGMINSYIFDFGTTGCLFSTTVGAKAMSVSCLYGKFSLSQNCMIMQPITGNCYVRYFFYLFTFIFGYYRSLIPDNMQPSFRIKDFYAYSMLMPSEIEQKEIAVYLDTKCVKIDKVVEQTRATIEEYKKLKQAIITEAVTKGVRGARPMKPSGVEWIGDIPEEWEACKLKYLLAEKLTYGANETADGYNPSHPRYIRITDIAENGKLKDDSAQSLLPEIAEPYLLKKGDILLARSGATAGKSFLFNEGIEACFAGYLIRARVNNKIISKFLYYYTKSKTYTNWCQIIQIQSTIQNISGDKYINLMVTVPSEDEQQEIVSFLDTKCAEIDRIIEKKEQLIEEIGSYKKSLIYECVTGKREIKIHNYSQGVIC